MRLIHCNTLSLKWFSNKEIPPYAILSHTWGQEEVTLKEFTKGSAKHKNGYRKIMFCTRKAEEDGLGYIWVDTCCIDKGDSIELQEAINSMWLWYRNAVKCYVYLSDVSTDSDQTEDRIAEAQWKMAFRHSRWFTRGWTLQELLAPSTVEFFSSGGKRLGDKNSLDLLIHGITNIPLAAIHGSPMSEFSLEERLRWAQSRWTTRIEDGAYCLLGLFNLSMPLLYGEGNRALWRLRRTLEESGLAEAQRLDRKTAIADIAQAIQGYFGITISNRRWRLKLYYNCFSVPELLKWLMWNIQNVTTRDDAVEFSKYLMKQGLFEHVNGRQGFEDGSSYFYSICQPFRISQREMSAWHLRNRGSVDTLRVNDIAQAPLVALETGDSFGDADIDMMSVTSSEVPSLTSETTIDSLGVDVDEVSAHLAEILCSSKAVGSLYVQAIQKLGGASFSQSHGEILKLYFKGLRHQVSNATELGAVRLLRSRRSRIEVTSLILTSLECSQADQGQLTQTALAKGKTERGYSLNHYLRSRMIPGYDESLEQPLLQDAAGEDTLSDSDDSSEGSKDELPGESQTPLQNIDAFLTKGNAFNQLKINLTSLSHPPATLEDALSSGSEFVVQRSLARIMNGQPSAEQEKILRLREQNSSTAEMARHLLRKAQLQQNESTQIEEDLEQSSKTPAVHDGLQQDLEPDKGEDIGDSINSTVLAISTSELHKAADVHVPIVSPEPRAVTWTCSCGVQLCDYFTELVPGSLDELQSRLRAEHVQPKTYWKQLGRTLIEFARSRFVVIAHDQGGQNQVSPRKTPGQTSQAGTSMATIVPPPAGTSADPGSNGPSVSIDASMSTAPVQSPSIVSYLLLCLPEGLSGVKMFQQQIMSPARFQDHTNIVRNDQQLFRLLRRTYSEKRKVLFSRFWPKTVIRVSLANFLVDIGEYVELRHYACSTGGNSCQCIPPPEKLKPSLNAVYECTPREPRYKPPLGIGYLTHYFKYPDCISDKLDTVLKQIPKRIEECYATSGSERIEAWGIEFEEGWDQGRLRNFLFILVVVGTLLFAVLWSVFKKDMSSAFGMAAYFVGILAAVGSYVASANPRTTHK